MNMKSLLFSLVTILTTSIWAAGPSILELGFSAENMEEAERLFEETADEDAQASSQEVVEPGRDVEVEKEVVHEVVTNNAVVVKEVTVTNVVEVVRDVVNVSEVVVVTNVVEHHELRGNPNPQPKTGRPAKVTSRNTFYDRKEGVALFDGTVHVDDESFQMWADKAYVFMADTNDIRRIVAIGNVAITNEARRAYGYKASYYKDGGMVVLYSSPDLEQIAEVRDESKPEDQSVKGSKIKFWIDAEQVEVIDSVIQAPTKGGGMSDLKSLNKKK